MASILGSRSQEGGGAGPKPSLVILPSWQALASYLPTARSGGARSSASLLVMVLLATSRHSSKRHSSPLLRSHHTDTSGGLCCATEFQLRHGYCHDWLRTVSSDNGWPSFVGRMVWIRGSGASSKSGAMVDKLAHVLEAGRQKNAKTFFIQIQLTP